MKKMYLFMIIVLFLFSFYKTETIEINKILKEDISIKNDSDDNTNCFEAIVETMEKDVHWEGTGFKYNKNGIFIRGEIDQGQFTVDWLKQEMKMYIAKEFWDVSSPLYSIINFKERTYHYFDYQTDQLIIDDSESWKNGELTNFRNIEELYYNRYIDYFDSIGCSLKKIESKFEEMKDHYVNDEYLKLKEDFVSNLQKNTAILDGLWELKDSYSSIWEHPAYELKKVITIEKFKKEFSTFKGKQFLFVSSHKYDFDFKIDKNYQHIYERYDSLDYRLNDFIYKFFWNSSDAEIQEMLYVVDYDNQESFELVNYLDVNLSEQSNNIQPVFELFVFSDGEILYSTQGVEAILSAILVPYDIEHSLNNYSINLPYWATVEMSNQLLRGLGLRTNE